MDSLEADLSKDLYIDSKHIVLSSAYLSLSLEVFKSLKGSLLFSPETYNLNF